MANTSRIGAAQDALKVLIAARAAISTVKTNVGEPKDFAREQIWIPLDVEDWTQALETTGNDDAPLEENFTLLVKVFVQQTGNDPIPLRNRLLTIVGEVEKALRADRTISGTVENEALITRGEIVEGLVDQERAVVATLRVRCRATLV